MSQSIKYEPPTRAAEIPGGYRCDNCHERDALVIWSEGAIAYVHGQKAYWCEACVLTEQIPYAREAAARLKEMEERLKQLNSPHVHRFWRTDPETKVFIKDVCTCGAQQCKTCMGTGHMGTDWGCFGPKKFVRCTKCGGRGIQRCEECAGSGKQKCTACSGRGFIITPGCMGGSTSMCRNCDGTGKSLLACPSCKGERS